MSQTWTCFKKEFTANRLNFHLYLLSSIFIIFGIINVLTAKFTPQLIKMMVSEEMATTLPAPTELDVWMQFHKNFSQVLLVILVLFFSNILTKERQAGTLIIPLTKGLKRSSVLLGKWLWLVVSSSIYFLLLTGTTLLYTLFYFDQAEFDQLTTALLALWLFTVLICTLIILGSVLSQQSYAVLLIIGFFMLTLILLNTIKQLVDYNPLQLLNQFIPLIEINTTAVSLRPATLTTIGFILIGLISSLQLFNHKDI